MFSITHEWIFVHHEEKLWHLGSTPHKLAFDHLPTHTSTLQLSYEIVFLSRDHATIRRESKLDLKLVVPVQFLKFFWKYFGQGTLNYSPSDFVEPRQLCLREMYTIKKIDISSAVHFLNFANWVWWRQRTAGAKFSKFHQLRLRTTYRSAKLPKFHQLRLRGQCTHDQNFILKVHLRVGGLTLHKPADEI